MLEKNAYKLLLEFYKKDKIMADAIDKKYRCEIYTLDNYLYVLPVSEKDSDGFSKDTGELGITSEGRAYVQSQRKASRKTVGEWIRFSISTLIALTALAIAIWAKFYS